MPDYHHVAKAPVKGGNTNLAIEGGIQFRAPWHRYVHPVVVAAVPASEWGEHLDPVWAAELAGVIGEDQHYLQRQVRKGLGIRDYCLVVPVAVEHGVLGSDDRVLGVFPCAVAVKDDLEHRVRSLYGITRRFYLSGYERTHRVESRARHQYLCLFKGYGLLLPAQDHGQKKQAQAYG